MSRNEGLKDKVVLISISTQRPTTKPDAVTPIIISIALLPA